MSYRTQDHTNKGLRKQVHKARRNTSRKGWRGRGAGRSGSGIRSPQRTKRKMCSSRFISVGKYRTSSIDYFILFFYHIFFFYYFTPFYHCQFYLQRLIMISKVVHKYSKFSSFSSSCCRPLHFNPPPALLVSSFSSSSSYFSFCPPRLVLLLLLQLWFIDFSPFHQSPHVLVL